ncbi:FACT complex subunit SSRP1 [Hondaea fermentalgiana]|uniref:FACT complex subunit SSRP1 n=1 Tax=Hondaea fermentalgiana TaxID=2315210 RepID=A0A2R5G474_9STRA|nr:FACT complex subunit SSRP1 [Hondaea fermentalgiana]|eukprot:GBG25109.1 FACT complex subunit SSRP1 [Hondaea fermentalgiana]
MAGERHQYSNVVNTTNSRENGHFVLSYEGLLWRPSSGDASAKTIVIKPADIADANWTVCGRNATLQVFMGRESGGDDDDDDDDDDENEVDAKKDEEGKDDAAVAKKKAAEKPAYERFDGFKRGDYDTFQHVFAEHYGVKELPKQKLSAAGINAGELNVDSTRKAIALKYNGRIALDIPLQTLSQCAAPSKNEVELQFDVDDTGQREDEVLIEMKLYVPPGEHEEDLSEALQQEIVSASGIQRTSAGDFICRFPEEIGTFLSPRGRYEVEMHTKFFRMTGRTYSYTVMYKHITRMFLLPRPEGQSDCFVISLSDPLTQGKVRHRHLVMQLERRDEEIHLNMTKEELKEKYDNNLQEIMSGNLPDIVAKIFKYLAGKKCFVPGNFTSSTEAKCVKCSLGTSNGLLFPLQRAFFFIHKPATYFRYEDIDVIDFQRTGNSGAGAVTRGFDLFVTLRSVAGAQPQTYTFNHIDKRDYAPLYNFLNNKNIRIKDPKAAAADAEEGANEPNIMAQLGADESASEDEDFQSDDEQHASDSDSDDSDVSLASDDGLTGGALKDDADGDDDDDADPSGKRKRRKERAKKKEKEAKRKRRSSEGGGGDDDDDGDNDDKKKTKKQKKTKKKRDPNAPARAKTAYMHFSDAQRAEQSGIDMAEIASKWKAISDEDKEKFTRLAKKDKERFEQEMADYKPPSGYDSKGMEIVDDDDGGDDEKGAKKRKKKTKKERDPNAPKKPSNSYQLYSAHIREQAKGDVKYSFAELSEKWKALSDEDKVPYEEEAAKLKEKYAQDMKAYEAKKKEEGTADGAVKKEAKSTTEKKPKKKDAKVKKEDDAEVSDSSSSSGSGSGSGSSSGSGSGSDSSDDSGSDSDDDAAKKKTKKQKTADVKKES